MIWLALFVVASAAGLAVGEYLHGKYAQADFDAIVEELPERGWIPDACSRGVHLVGTPCNGYPLNTCPRVKRKPL